MLNSQDTLNVCDESRMVESHRHVNSRRHKHAHVHVFYDSDRSNGVRESSRRHTCDRSVWLMAWVRVHMHPETVMCHPTSVMLECTRGRQIELNTRPCTRIHC